jgi:hypothetical protein
MPVSFAYGMLFQQPDMALVLSRHGLANIYLLQTLLQITQPSFLTWLLSDASTCFHSQSKCNTQQGYSLHTLSCYFHSEPKLARACLCLVSTADGVNGTVSPFMDPFKTPDPYTGTVRLPFSEPATARIDELERTYECRILREMGS